MPTPSELRNSLRFFKVTSYVTGVFLLLISILYAMMLTISADIWVAGPQGLVALAQFSVDPATGDRFGFPTEGFSFTVVSLIVHGWLYVVYLYANFRLWILLRWGIGKFLLIAAGGVVPFLSFFTERYYSKVAESWSERNDSA
jgi:integral membrane protein